MFHIRVASVLIRAFFSSSCFCIYLVYYTMFFPLPFCLPHLLFGGYFILLKDRCIVFGGGIKAECERNHCDVDTTPPTFVKLSTPGDRGRVREKKREGAGEGFGNGGAVPAPFCASCGALRFLTFAGLLFGLSVVFFLFVPRVLLHLSVSSFPFFSLVHRSFPK